MQLHRVGESAGAGQNLIGELGIKGVGFGGEDAYGLPLFNVQGFQPIGDSLLCTPCNYDNKLLQIGDRLTWARGQALAQGGRRLPVLQVGHARVLPEPRVLPVHERLHDRRPRPTMAPDNALASFLLGLPTIKQRQAGLPSMNMRQPGYEVFLQDDWRIRTHLTVNLGPALRIPDAPARRPQDPDEPGMDRWQALGVRGRAGRDTRKDSPTRIATTSRRVIGASYNPGGGQVRHAGRLRRVLRLPGDEPLVQPGAQRAARLPRDPDEQQLHPHAAAGSTSPNPCWGRPRSASRRSTRTGRSRSSSRRARASSGNRWHDGRRGRLHGRVGPQPRSGASREQRRAEPAAARPAAAVPDDLLRRGHGAPGHVADRRA